VDLHFTNPLNFSSSPLDLAEAVLTEFSEAGQAPFHSRSAAEFGALSFG